jgi:hypothetical protein
VLVNDAIRLLSRIPNWSVLHVKRNANEAAHALAKLALAFEKKKVVGKKIKSTFKGFKSLKMVK